MEKEEISRKNLDSQEFLQLRQATDKIAKALDKRLKAHLTVLRPLFVPRKLFGTYIKSSVAGEVPGSDKAFAELQEQYAAISAEPFGLPKKLQPPLPPISNQLEGTPLEYALYSGGYKEKATSVTSPTKWVLSYRGECPLNRLKAMVSGAETRQADDMKQALIDHLTIVIFLNHFKGLTQLLQDLRYEVETIELADLGGLPVVVLKAPLETFLPPDDFILQITQLSGIPAFQEIVDFEAVKNIPDPLKESLTDTLGQS
jgi:hypothetical protein